jgi:hypothetical protein
VYVEAPASVADLKEIGDRVIEKAKNDTPFNALEIEFVRHPNKNTPVTNGQIVFAPNGEWGKARSVDTGQYGEMDHVYEYLEPVKAENSQSKFGLTVKQRKILYKEVAKAEQIAWKKAENKYPTTNVDPQTYDENIDKFDVLESKLVRRYRRQIAEKYDITLDQLDKVINEGAKKRWPSPPVSR